MLAFFDGKLNLFTNNDKVSLHPKPQTLNPEPQTLNPTPQTLNPTLKSQPKPLTKVGLVDDLQQLLSEVFEDR